MTFRDLIDAWPSCREFAAEIGVTVLNARQMRNRDSIAPEHWPALVSAAKARGIEGATFETLAQMARRRKQERSAA